jgi:hypothetical protein
MGVDFKEFVPLPLLRLRPTPQNQINQGQITIQESAQFGGQPSSDEIVL